MPLTEPRAAARTWLEAHPTKTNANVAHWLYQNEWIVTGAKFGWWHGADALTTLIAVDRRAQQLWGIGIKSALAGAERSERGAVEVEVKRSWAIRAESRATASSSCSSRWSFSSIVLGEPHDGVHRAARRRRSNLNLRFQAQQNARLALDRIRVDIHCATAAQAQTINTYPGLKLNESNCYAATPTISWCVVQFSATPVRYQLFRSTGDRRDRLHVERRHAGADRRLSHELERLHDRDDPAVHAADGRHRLQGRARTRSRRRWTSTSSPTRSSPATRPAAYRRRLHGSVPSGAMSKRLRQRRRNRARDGSRHHGRPHHLRRVDDHATRARTRARAASRARATLHGAASTPTPA